MIQFVCIWLIKRVVHMMLQNQEQKITSKISVQSARLAIKILFSNCFRKYCKLIWLNCVRNSTMEHSKHIHSQGRSKEDMWTKEMWKEIIPARSRIELKFGQIHHIWIDRAFVYLVFDIWFVNCLILFETKKKEKTWRKTNMYSQLLSYLLIIVTFG